VEQVAPGPAADLAGALGPQGELVRRGRGEMGSAPKPQKGHPDRLQGEATGGAAPAAAQGAMAAAAEVAAWRPRW